MEAANDIGRGLGRVIEVDNKAFSTEQVKFLRVRIEIPLAQPLRRRGLVVSLKGDRTWVAFWHKLIVGMCFSCERLGYEVKACTHTKPGTTKRDLPYGEQLKASEQWRLEGTGRRSKSPPKQPYDELGSQRTATLSPRAASLTTGVESHEGKDPRQDSDTRLDGRKSRTQLLIISFPNKDTKGQNQTWSHRM